MVWLQVDIPLKNISLASTHSFYLILFPKMSGIYYGWVSLLKENERMTKFCCKRYKHVLSLSYEDKNSQIMFRWLDNMLHKEKLKFFKGRINIATFFTRFHLQDYYWAILVIVLLKAFFRRPTPFLAEIR